MLREHGVEVVVGYPGGAILPVYDAIHDSPHFKFILPRAEGGGGHMAEGYARVSGKPGVLLVTSGPGATNLVTPLADALMDGTPLVALTGQVSTSAIGSDAFQEADVVGITRSCTKWNTLVRDVRDIPRAINEAFVRVLDKGGGGRGCRAVLLPPPVPHPTHPPHPHPRRLLPRAAPAPSSSTCQRM